MAQHLDEGRDEEESEREEQGQENFLVEEVVVEGAKAGDVFHLSRVSVVVEVAGGRHIEQ